MLNFCVFVICKLLDISVIKMHILNFCCWKKTFLGVPLSLFVIIKWTKMNANKALRIVLILLCSIAIVSCDNDEVQDTYSDILMQVSENTDLMYPMWGEFTPTECLRVKEQGDHEKWHHLGINEIEGFVYEKGHAYELKVRKTRLANPPADASMYTYKLLQIISDTEVFPEHPQIPDDLLDEAKFGFKMLRLTPLNNLNSPVAAPFDFLTFRILDHKGEYSFPDKPKFVEYYDSIVMASPNMPDTYKVYYKEREGSAVMEGLTSQWGSYFFERTDFPIVLKGYKDEAVIYETSLTQVMRERDFLGIDWTKGDITTSNPVTHGIYCLLDIRWEYQIVDTRELDGTLYTTLYAQPKPADKPEYVYIAEQKEALRLLLWKHLGKPVTVALSEFKTLPEGVEVVETFQNASTRAALIYRPEDDYNLEKYYVVVEGRK